VHATSLMYSSWCVQPTPCSLVHCSSALDTAIIYINCCELLWIPYDKFRVCAAEVGRAVLWHILVVMWSISCWLRACWLRARVLVTDGFCSVHALQWSLSVLSAALAPVVSCLAKAQVVRGCSGVPHLQHLAWLPTQCQMHPTTVLCPRWWTRHVLNMGLIVVLCSCAIVCDSWSHACCIYCLQHAQLCAEFALWRSLFEL
jgi:hypothetical protein